MPSSNSALRARSYGVSSAVRRLTARAAHRGDAVVYNSARRVRAYGYINTLRWYRNHGYRGGEVDVR